MKAERMFREDVYKRQVLDDIEYIIETGHTNWQTYFIGDIEPKIQFEL